MVSRGLTRDTASRLAAQGESWAAIRIFGIWSGLRKLFPLTTFVPAGCPERGPGLQSGASLSALPEGAQRQLPLNGAALEAEAVASGR